MLLFLTFLFLNLFIIQKHYEHKRLLQLLHSVQVEKEYVFDRILELQGKALKTFVYDYTFWDEMVDFVKAPDKTWAHDNIEISLATYGSNAAWVYNLNRELVYSVNSHGNDLALKELPVPRAALSGLFAHSPFCHFFVNTTRGFLEFWGASIHGSSDAKRETPAQGYFFCSRLWVNNYIAELAQLTDSIVVLSDAAENSRFKKNGSDSISFTRKLTDWDNQPVKYLLVSATSEAIVSAKKSALQVAVLFLSFSVIILLIVSFFIFFWINVPLRLITLSLEKGDSSFLKKIKNQNTEFGDVSRMVDSFFTQRKAVFAEITQRKLTQEALNKVNNCFVSFGVDPDKNIQLITETAGQILDATCMLYNRSHNEMLVTEAGWHEPAGFSRSTLGKGHICFDVIANQSDQLVVINDLQHTRYAQTDPNVRKYNLQSYVTCPVKLAGKTIASFCAVYTYAVKIDQYHLDLLQVLGKAASIEEERKYTEKEFKFQAGKLDNALHEALKSRAVLLSMLEDNYLNKVKLEQSVQELALAYSRLKESQEEVLQAAKFGAIGQLASSVAHEVRNPLAIIMQAIEYLENKIALEDKDIIQVAKNNIKRANTIVSTLLDFSKAKKLNIMLEDINSIVEDSIILTRYTNLKDRVKVFKELSEDLPKVLVDRQKMEQVLVNLNLNAIQAMPKGGNLFLRTYLTEFSRMQEAPENKLNHSPLLARKAVTIEIEDQGVGISEENMKNLFRPFFTTKGEMLGVGLGLSVAKDIVTMHNGQIEIKSKVNQGTKVIITLGVEKEGGDGKEKDTNR